jgi:hypothetical protein
VSKAGVEITATIPLLRPIMVSINDDRDIQEEELEPFGLPSVWLVSPPSLPSLQITPQGVSLSILTPAQHPLRC